MSAEFWPANVSRLHDLGIRYEHRASSHDVVLRCLCGDKLVMDAREPWHHCFGPLNCPARGMTFEQVVEALKSREP
jgi:hypothetical protein